MNCTWKDCTRPAVYSIPDRDGNEWANLCEKHKKKLGEATASLDPKKLLGAWACAGKMHPRRKQQAETCAKSVGALFDALMKRKKS